MDDGTSAILRPSTLLLLGSLAPARANELGRPTGAPSNTASRGKRAPQMMSVIIQRTGLSQ